MLDMVKQSIRNGLGRLGYDLVRRQDPRTPQGLKLECTDLLALHRRTEAIPGMIGIATAELLYAVGVTQQVQGDIVEIGSWQGKSTGYLARAAMDSGNGRVFAVDHFRGNVGKEGSYAVGGGLGSLHAQFERNMASLGVSSIVETIPCSSREAHALIKDRAVRLLFIDGDHSEEGVTTDIELFCPLVVPGGIVMFDDFDVTFPGVVRSAERWISTVRPRSVFVRDNLLVCFLR